MTQDLAKKIVESVGDANCGEVTFSELCPQMFFYYDELVTAVSKVLETTDDSTQPENRRSD